MHYPKLELPWQPNTAKENTKTAKEMILGGWPPSKIRQEWSAKEIQFQFPWLLAAKYCFLGGTAAKKTRTPAKSTQRQENLTTAKEIKILGCHDPPWKTHFLAAHTCLGYMVPWLPLPAKNFGISLATNRQNTHGTIKKL